MTDKEILYKVILKTGKSKNEAELISAYYSSKAKYMNFIFYHKFAKAFFGEESTVFITCNDCDGNGWTGSPYTRVWDCKECNNTGMIKTGNPDNEGWQYHLSKMVLEKEPIKYLEKFL